MRSDQSPSYLSFNAHHGEAESVRKRLQERRGPELLHSREGPVRAEVPQGQICIVGVSVPTVTCIDMCEDARQHLHIFTGLCRHVAVPMSHGLGIVCACQMSRTICTWRHVLLKSLTRQPYTREAAPQPATYHTCRDKAMYILASEKSGGGVPDAPHARVSCLPSFAVHTRATHVGEPLQASNSGSASSAGLNTRRVTW